MRGGRTQQRSLAELLCEPVEPLLEARSEPAVVVPLLDDSLRDLQRLVILDDEEVQGGLGRSTLQQGRRRFLGSSGKQTWRCDCKAKRTLWIATDLMGAATAEQIPWRLGGLHVAWDDELVVAEQVRELIALRLPEPLEGGRVLARADVEDWHRRVSAPCHEGIEDVADPDVEVDDDACTPPHLGHLGSRDDPVEQLVCSIRPDLLEPLGTLHRDHGRVVHGSQQGLRIEVLGVGGI